MKKTIILLAAATLTTSLCAQTQNHLKFNGIPINGSISSFAKEMVNLNYEFMEQNEDTYFFTGRDECIGNTLVVVACLPENAGSTVFAVMMTSPAQPSFNSCEAIYKRVQKNLDKNYGEGYYEEVINPEDDKDDLNRMIAIVKGQRH